MNNKNKLKLLRLRCKKLGYEVKILEDGIIDLLGNSRKIRNANINEALTKVIEL